MGKGKKALSHIVAMLTAATQQYASQSELKRLYAAPTKTSPQYSAALASRFQALTPRPAHAGVASAASPPVTAYDPFYSPMLQRLDTVFGHLGVQEEGCRERLVCSMYKNPARFSPHSNLVSAELSRQFRLYQVSQTAAELPVITPHETHFYPTSMMSKL
ncbi:Protein of unknown function (DUF1676) [Homalodisca vitripennis]|nr:Protein of unknown function (DUF1676) [Homalodisca vitripennis]